MRLLYLGTALPPGMSALYPDLTPAGHAFETHLVTGLREYFEVRTVTLLPFLPDPSRHSQPLSSGLSPDLVLPERYPELYHRWRALVRLRRVYRQWQLGAWTPDILLVLNLSPVYVSFCQWLRSSGPRPKLALVLSDSPTLGSKRSRLDQLRYRFKPMFVSAERAFSIFDACVGLSQTTDKHFQSRRIPWLWMPGGCSPQRAIRRDETAPHAGPIRFGYFGSLAAYAGLPDLIRIFAAREGPETLDICGYGKAAETVAQLCRSCPRLRFHGLLPAPEDCLRFAQTCDVLVNPRPAGHGNQNNFPSKVFEYALSGRAILSSRLSGVEQVLGPAAFYFDERHLDGSLGGALAEIARTPRAELRRRGREVQEHVTRRYSWTTQAERMNRFLRQCAGA